MKKLFALLLALLLILSLVACGQETQSADESTEKVEDVDTKKPVEKTDEKTGEGENASETDVSSTVPEPDVTTPSEEIDMSAFTLGVSEDGENVLVTVKNETDVGTVTCVMTFWYSDGKLVKETADYYVPDAETAGVLADELKQDDTIEAGSIQINGNCVSCTMKESELAELQELTHDELVAAMTYAIESMQ